MAVDNSPTVREQRQGEDSPCFRDSFHYGRVTDNPNDSSLAGWIQRREPRVDPVYRNGDSLTEPVLALEQLPPVDLVVWSHLHGDHFDRRVERDLDHSLPIVTTRRAAASLEKKGFHRPLALRTWEEASFVRDLVRLRTTSMPGRHGPWLLSRLLPPVMGSRLEFMTSDRVLLRIYISGDTLFSNKLETITRRYGSIDRALVHLGGTRVLGLLVTTDGNQGVSLSKLLRPKVAILIHFDDYTVFKSPLSDFQAEAGRADLTTEVRYLRHGQRYSFEVSDVEKHRMQQAS